ncbi:MAG: NAD(P)(+) transhydrogenase (Re/Si-specific) subunit alpha, partial [Bacteroidota bacterium]
MILGLLKEYGHENRVALLPEAVQNLVDQKVDVWVEQKAGIAAFATDASYTAVGAKIVTRDELFQKADVLLQIQAPEA